MLFAAQLTLGFFSISFHLRSHEDLREELVTRLRVIYNEPGGEFFSPALDYVQTKVKVLFLKFGIKINLKFIFKDFGILIFFHHFTGNTMIHS